MSMCVKDSVNKTAVIQPVQTVKQGVAKDCANSVSEPKKQIPTSQKIGVGVCTALGVATSLAVLAKFGKKSYSLNPKKMFTTKWKDTYLANASYKTKEVVTIGLGSCIGGLVGGAIFDKDKNNIKAKAQEGIAGITNIALPVGFVETMSIGGKFISKKMMPNWLKSGDKLKMAVAKSPQVIGAMAGLGVGMVAANKVANKINEIAFGKKDDRPIKTEDFAAHVDDLCVAATLVAENNPVTKFVSRFIPAFLLVAGYKTGNKTKEEM